MHRATHPALLLAAVACLSACGNDAPTPGTAPGPTPGTTPAPAPGPTPGTTPAPGRAPGAAPAGGAAKPRTLTLVTYNVLADPDTKAKRVPALLKLLDETDADIIVLQEAATWFLHSLRAEPWVSAGKYQFPTGQGGPIAARGLFIMAKHPIARFQAWPMPGRQGRALLVTTINIDGHTTLVATVHLESLLEAGPTRAAQLDLVFEKLRKPEEAILLGDFNFGDGEKPETTHLDPAYADAWSVLRPADPGFTWNIEQSPMAARASFPNESSRRIDRILVKSNFWKPKSVRIIGNHPLDPDNPDQPDLYPSDHFGLVAVLEAHNVQDQQPGD